jgi:two-component system sensor histidine kinase HydH
VIRYSLAVEDILAKAIGQEATDLDVDEKRDLLVRLLSRLAHEVRNPLSSLDVHIQLLEEDMNALAPQVLEQFNPRLQFIHGELHRLESIVERFLRLAGPSALDLERVDSAKIVGHVCDLLRPEAAARGIEVASRVEDGLPRIMADPIRLTQALLNLVINAIQAIQHNGRVDVSARKSPPGDGIVFCVQDNGPGIPAGTLKAVFDPYFTTKSEGSGLGLWIAQQIAVAHGGRITAQNADPKGAVFLLTLPFERKEKPGG